MDTDINECLSCLVGVGTFVAMVDVKLRDPNQLTLPIPCYVLPCHHVYGWMNPLRRVADISTNLKPMKIIEC